MAGMYKNLKEIKFRLEKKGKKDKEILKKIIELDKYINKRMNRPNNGHLFLGIS